MAKVVICDLDGCIVDDSEREKNADEKAKRYSELWWNILQDPRMVPTDKPIRYSREVLTLLSKQGNEIFYLSGRRSEMREATEWWLKVNRYPPGIVRLRPKGESTTVFKLKWAEHLVKKGVSYAFDNDRNIISEYAKLGINAIAVRTKNEDDWRRILMDLITARQSTSVQKQTTLF